jgi:hypothetical protein
VKKHAIEVGIPADVFEPKEQKVFAVRDCDFKEVIPVLLVSILGSRASYMQDLAEGIETKGKRAKSYRDQKRGTEPRTWDYHIGEKDEFKALTKLRSTHCQTPNDF